MSVDNNETAFPIVHPDGMGVQYYGMTLRDYFAAKAMAQLIPLQGDRLPWNHKEVASEAYLIADSMLSERGK